MALRIRITNDCDLCGECVEACIPHILTTELLEEFIDNDGGILESDKCQYCESCQIICPNDCITVTNPLIGGL